MDHAEPSATTQNIKWVLERHEKVRESALAASRHGALLSMGLIAAWKLWAPQEGNPAPLAVAAVVILLVSVVSSSLIPIVSAADHSQRLAAAVRSGVSADLLRWSASARVLGVVQLVAGGVGTACVVLAIVTG